jgi:hypothetical protein
LHFHSCLATVVRNKHPIKTRGTLPDGLPALGTSQAPNYRNHFMLKDSTYKEKFATLSAWMPLIIETIKKDLKNEHLRKDPGFSRLYFPGKNPAKLTSEELSAAYLHAIADGENAEELAEFISNRWLLKNGDLYHYFEQELGKINPNFNEITDIDKPVATAIMEGAVKQFGAISTYLFCVLNSVVFPEEIYKKLSQDAIKREVEEKAEAMVSVKELSAEAMQRNHEQQVARLSDKYEKKILGLQKKYIQDVEILKKQIANLQRKLTV